MSSYLRWLSARLAEHVSPDERFQVASRHVIGWAVGKSLAQITPFVRSLRAMFDGEITLIVDPDAGLEDLLSSAEVRAVIPPRAVGWTPDPVLSRIAVFEHLLRHTAPEATLVLTSVGDVVFQGDPLSPPPAMIEAFASTSGTSQTDPVTALQAGTVAAPSAALSRLCRSVLEAPPSSGSDAAGPGPDLSEIRFALSSHRFAAAGSPGRGRTRLIDGVLVNPDGVVSPILHRYDEEPRLAAAVERRWGGAATQRFRRHSRRLLSPLDHQGLPPPRRLLKQT